MAKKSTKQTDDFKTPKTLGPYDIINMMFTDFEKFNKLTDVILEKNYFMINRVFSIKYPLHGSMFNNENINKAQVIRSWAMFGTSKEGYGRVPSFVYTRGAKKSDGEKNPKDQFDIDIVKAYCTRYSITLKDFNTLMDMYQSELIDDVKRYIKLTSVKEQEKNIK